MYHPPIRSSTYERLQVLFLWAYGKNTAKLTAQGRHGSEALKCKRLGRWQAKERQGLVLLAIQPNVGSIIWYRDHAVLGLPCWPAKLMNIWPDRSPFIRLSFGLRLNRNLHFRCGFHRRNPTEGGAIFPIPSSESNPTATADEAFASRETNRGAPRRFRAATWCSAYTACLWRGPWP